jgi:ribosomal protein S18 acetylase RimI-like enzyme
MDIVYKTSLTDVDWVTLKEILAADNFDNGRTPEQLRTSFQNSYAAVMAYDDDRIIGTARALSDGVCNAYIVDFWTSSTHRRKGVGRRMMDTLETSLEGQHIYLFSDAAVEFYKALSFKEQPTGLSKVKGEWLNNGKRDS